jgi:hypothetical protein
MQERLLKDDTLAPPPADAPSDVKRTYAHTVNSIAAGHDPLTTTPPSPTLSREAVQQRLKERQKAARERTKEIQEAHKKEAEERKKKHQEQRPPRPPRDPNIPPSPPLFEPPKLGPPVLNDDGTPMAPAPRTPPTPPQ